MQIPLHPPLAVNETRLFTLVAHRDPESWPVEQTPVLFALPEVRLPQVGVIEALYGIAVDDDLDIRPLNVVGLDPARTRVAAGVRMDREEQVRPFPIGDGRALFERLKGVKTFVAIPGGDHNDLKPADERLYWNAVDAFIRAITKPSNPAP